MIPNSPSLNSINNKISPSLKIIMSWNFPPTTSKQIKYKQILGQDFHSPKKTLDRAKQQGHATHYNNSVTETTK